MEWIEMLQLRSYNSADRDEAVWVFHELFSKDQKKRIGNIKMGRNVIIENDLCIFFSWHGKLSEIGKSQLGLQLAQTFSQFGQIYHSAWKVENKPPRNKRKGPKK